MGTIVTNGISQLKKYVISRETIDAPKGTPDEKLTIGTWED